MNFLHQKKWGSAQFPHVKSSPTEMQPWHPKRCFYVFKWKSEEVACLRYCKSVHQACCVRGNTEKKNCHTPECVLHFCSDMHVTDWRSELRPNAKTFSTAAAYRNTLLEDQFSHVLMPKCGPRLTKQPHWLWSAIHRRFPLCALQWKQEAVSATHFRPTLCWGVSILASSSATLLIVDTAITSSGQWIHVLGC